MRHRHECRKPHRPLNALLMNDYLRPSLPGPRRCRQGAHLRQEQQRVLVGESDLVALAPPPPLGINWPPCRVCISAASARPPCTAMWLRHAPRVETAGELDMRMVSCGHAGRARPSKRTVTLRRRLLLDATIVYTHKSHTELRAPKYLPGELGSTLRGLHGHYNPRSA